LFYKKPGNQVDAAKEEFTIPKASIDLQLECAQIRPADLLVLKFYTEFQWLMDFTVCAVFIYAATEVYYVLVRPASETNLSLLWCLIVAIFALKVFYNDNIIINYLISSDKIDINQIKS